MKHTTKYASKLLDKVFAVLRSFSVERPRLTFSEVMRHNARIDRTTLYRILMNLTDQGFLRKNGKTGQFAPGVEFLRFARICRAGFDLRETARPFMEKVHQDTGETVLLNIRSGYTGMCLDCIKSTKPLTITADVGRQVPLLRGASGMILVAYLSDEDIRLIYEHERPFLNEEFESLLEKVRVIRKNGYAVSFSALDPETAGVSFPIRDISGDVVAGLSALGPESRFEGGYLEKIIAVTGFQAKKFNRSLGYEEDSSATPENRARNGFHNDVARVEEGEHV
ncbi:MAG: IclR family transcriptional regulator [Desulfovibrio sp.]|jgi:DNA-binding IclR family transcriptional regulator|nr:IclR family transcriptional regulator [Desulfovibrio sp.]